MPTSRASTRQARAIGASRRLADWRAAGFDRHCAPRRAARAGAAARRHRDRDLTGVAATMSRSEFVAYSRERRAHWDGVARRRRTRPGWGGYYHRRLAELLSHHLAG